MESSLSFKCFISFNNAITSCPLSPFTFFVYLSLLVCRAVHPRAQSHNCLSSLCLRWKDAVTMECSVACQRYHSGWTEQRREEHVCVLCASFALAHTNHYMIKSSYCITQKTQIHPHGGHPCYICNLEHILLHSRAPRYTLAMHTTPPSTSSTKVPDVWAWMHQQCLSPDLKLTYAKQQSRSSLSRDTQRSTDGAQLQILYKNQSPHSVSGTLECAFGVLSSL